MKLVTALSLAGVLGATVLSGAVTSPASAASHADCSATKPVSVYTDNLQHFVGLCVGAVYVQANEIADLTNGRQYIEGATGVAQVDSLLSGGLPAVTNLNSVQCSAGIGAIQIYTDGLQHIVGACDPFGDKVQVNEIAGALVARNNLVDLHLGVVSLNIQTQAQDGTNGIVLHPKIVITPGG